MKGWTIILAALALASCERSRSITADSSADARLDEGKVALYAVAPDGTRLWIVKGRDGRTVYFSSRGVDSAHSEPCGKGCTRTVDDHVPAEGE